MTLLLETSSMRLSYDALAAEVMDGGALVSPRGQLTREVSPAVVVLANPLDSLPLGTGRGVVQALACVEALSLIAGVAPPELFVAASPHYARYVDPETGELEVAYGPRVGPQMDDAEGRLRTDPSSRQAHVDFWSPADGPGLRAYPCVVSCGFTVRNGALDAFVEMRSNDLWLGTPYDMFAFTQLQATLANVLGCGLGEYSHYARSLHLYDRHWDKAKVLEPDHRGDNWEPTYSGVSGDTWAEASRRAATILRGALPANPTPSEGAYLRTMRDRVLPKVTG